MLFPSRPGWNIFLRILHQGRTIDRCYDASLTMGQVKRKICIITSFLSRQTCKTWHLSVCLKGQRHCAGTSCGPITPFIKTSRGIYNKGVGAILSHPSIYSLSPSAPVVAAGVMDDITQQGFARRYYHGAGISMEPGCLPCRAIDWGLLHDPNLLQGPSEEEEEEEQLQDTSPGDKL